MNCSLHAAPSSLAVIRLLLPVCSLQAIMHSTTSCHMQQTCCSARAAAAHSSSSLTDLASLLQPDSLNQLPSSSIQHTRTKWPACAPDQNSQPQMTPSGRWQADAHPGVQVVHRGYIWAGVRIQGLGKKSLKVINSLNLTCGLCMNTGTACLRMTRGGVGHDRWAVGGGMLIHMMLCRWCTSSGQATSGQGTAASWAWTG